MSRPGWEARGPSGSCQCRAHRRHQAGGDGHTPGHSCPHACGDVTWAAWTGPRALCQGGRLHKDRQPQNVAAKLARAHGGERHRWALGTEATQPARDYGYEGVSFSRARDSWLADRWETSPEL